jgi:DNA-binding transcriptional ArsR family regulator
VKKGGEDELTDEVVEIPDRLVDALRSRWRRDWCRRLQQLVQAPGQGPGVDSVRALVAIVGVLVDFADPGSGACSNPLTSEEVALMIFEPWQAVLGLYAACEELGAVDLVREEDGRVVRYRLNKRWPPPTHTQPQTGRSSPRWVTSSPASRVLIAAGGDLLLTNLEVERQIKTRAGTLGGASS